MYFSKLLSLCSLLVSNDHKLVNYRPIKDLLPSLIATDKLRINSNYDSEKALQKAINYANEQMFIN